MRFSPLVHRALTAAAQHPVDYDRFIISASARWRQAIYQGTEPFRSRANSLPGPFAPWPFRSLELLLPGPFAPEGQNHKMIKRHYKTPLTQYNRLSYRFYNRFDNRLYTRYSRLSNRLSYGFDNRLNVCTHDTTGCQASLTTDCIV